MGPEGNADRLPPSPQDGDCEFVEKPCERMAVIESHLRAGMTERGITGEAQEQIVLSITSFAFYGFPSPR